jgi:hypothetical protein
MYSLRQLSEHNILPPLYLVQLRKLEDVSPQIVHGLTVLKLKTVTPRVNFKGSGNEGMGSGKRSGSGTGSGPGSGTGKDNGTGSGTRKDSSN